MKASAAVHSRFATNAEQQPWSAPRLWVSQLRLSAFRNFRSAELEAAAGPVILTGPNGGGKTNVLEALSLLVPGRGLRRARLSDLSSRLPGNQAAADAGLWAVSAVVETAQGRRRVGTGLDPKARGGMQRERRAVRIDGEDGGSQQALGEILAAVWLTPETCWIFQEGSGARRRFLDRLVAAFQPAHNGRWTAYEQAMRERNRLLKQGQADASWLTALEHTMAERSVALAAARRELLQRLSAVTAQDETGFPRPLLGLSGEAEAWLESEAAVDVEERLAEALAASRRQDAESGGAAVGAHRCDLLVSRREEAGRPEIAAALCSTGEQKALLVALVLAHARLVAAERGAAPLLLLDEIATHLDAPHRTALFAALAGLGAQVWMTGNELAPFREIAHAARVVTFEGGVPRSS